MKLHTGLLAGPGDGGGGGDGDVSDGGGTAPIPGSL